MPSPWVWLALIAGGLACGLMTLLGAWVTSTRWQRRNIIIVLSTVALAAGPVSLWDTMLLHSPEWDRASAPPATFSTPAYHYYLIWFVVLLATLLFQIILLNFV